MNSQQPASYPIASLYVGDLNPDVTEAMLFEKFSTAGPVLSIRVCRDLATRRSLGYAYVNFQQPSDAERAIDTMNYDHIKGRPMRIMWSQRDPTLRRTGVGNVFIKNLDKSIDHKALFDTFSAFGSILSCKVAVDEYACSRGFGFVHFETREAADEAIKKVNGMMLNDKKVFVGNFMSKRERVDCMGDSQKQFKNVFVKNYGDFFKDDDQLKEFFKDCGEISSSVAMNNEDGSSKGFGFVAFAEHDGAEKAVEKFNNFEVEGKKLVVCRAQKKQERAMELKSKFEQQKQERISRYHGVNLYIKNLEDVVDDERLRKEFSNYGNITSAKVMCDDKGISKGFGFVCFSSPDEATKAVTEMNGRILVTKPLYVALAQRKDERRAQLASQFMQRVSNLRYQPGAAMQSQQMFQQPYYIPTPIQQPPPRGSYVAAAPQMNPLQRPTPKWNQSAYQPRPVTMPFQNGSSSQVGSASPANRVQQPRAPQGMVQQRHPAMSGQAVGTRPGNQMMRPAGGQPGQRSVAANYPVKPPGRVQNFNQMSEQVPPQLTSATLASANPTDQKQMIGERLFPRVQDYQPHMAGKITGMLLEIDNSELLHMLEDANLLKSKVEEAVQVLNAHQAKEATIKAQQQVAESRVLAE